MTPAIQGLLIGISVLLTALMTQLLGQVTGLRTDMKEYLKAQKDMNDRLLVLETEHGSEMCRRHGDCK